MKKKTKDNLLKGSILGVVGAAIAGGVGYLLSNKKTRKKLGKFVNDLEEKGGTELDKALESVKSAKTKSLNKVKEVSKEITDKNKTLN